MNNVNIIIFIFCVVIIFGIIYFKKSKKEGSDFSIALVRFNQQKRQPEINYPNTNNFYTDDMLNNNIKTLGDNLTINENNCLNEYIRILNNNPPPPKIYSNFVKYKCMDTVNSLDMFLKFITLKKQLNVSAVPNLSQYSWYKKINSTDKKLALPIPYNTSDHNYILNNDYFILANLIDNNNIPRSKAGITKKLTLDKKDYITTPNGSAVAGILLDNGIFVIKNSSGHYFYTTGSEWISADGMDGLQGKFDSSFYNTDKAYNVILPNTNVLSYLVKNPSAPTVKISTSPSVLPTKTSKFISHPNVNVNGSDIQCLPNTPLSTCMSLCDSNNTCKSVAEVPAGVLGGIWAKGSGCCYKSSNVVSGPLKGVNMWF